RREPEIYGDAGLEDIARMVEERAARHGMEVRFEQSNHEGELIDLLDAERDFGKPVVEVHLSNIHALERYRHTSLTASAARGIIAGLGPHGYVLAVDAVARILGITGTTE